MYYFHYDPVTYAGSWTLVQYSKTTYELEHFGSGWDLRGQTLTYLNADSDRETPFDTDLGQTIAERHNGSFKEADGIMECYDYVYSPRNGISMGTFTILPEMVQMCFIVPRSTPKSMFSILLDPFDPYSWGAFGATITILSLLLSMFGESYKRYNVILICLELVMNALNGPTHQFEGRFEARMIGLFMLMNVVLISCYQSLIISLMSTVRYDTELDTIGQVNETCYFQHDVYREIVGQRFKNTFRTFDYYGTYEHMWHRKVANRQYALSSGRIFIFPESELDSFLSLAPSIKTCIPYLFAYNPLTFHGSWTIFQSAGITWTLEEFFSVNRSMHGYEIVYLTMDFLRDVTYDLEIGHTIARRHNATFNRLVEFIPNKCVDYYYGPMYGGEAQYVPLPDTSELCFIVPKSAPKSVFLVLLDPYDRFSWIAFGLTVVALSLVLFWFGGTSRYTSVMLIGLEMLMIVLNGPTHRLVDRFERFVVGLFMLLSIVVISGYQSLVISFMSSSRYDPQLDTFDAINDTCLFIYDVQLSSLGYNFKNVHLTYEVFDSTELMWQVKWCTMVACTEAAYIMARVGDVDKPPEFDPGEIPLYNEEEWQRMKHQLKYFRYSKARVQSMTAMYLVAPDSPVRHHVARYTQAFVEGRLEYFPVLKK
uniref:Ionotropic glutamate receptor C-terminal domain-containing protein n=1 Tax=Anopheles stephensi TaxID=30069 RepID=A0A182YR39_ANOST